MFGLGHTTTAIGSCPKPVPQASCLPAHRESDDSANLTHYSFDTWGNRRDANDWSTILQSETGNHQSAMTDCGFTGHKQLDHLQLIHMNGRIYDPIIGRMISPDPLIQAPENLTGYIFMANAVREPLGKHHQDEARVYARKLYAAEANLRPDPAAGALTVEIHSLATPKDKRIYANNSTKLKPTIPEQICE